MPEQTKSQTLGVVGPPNTANHYDLQTLARSLLQTSKGRVTMVASALLLGDPMFAEVKRRMSPPAGLSVVHETQRFWRGEGFADDGHTEVSFETADSHEAAQFLFRLLQSGNPVAEMETRLRFVLPDQLGSLKGARFMDRMGGRHAIETSSRPISSQDVGAYVHLAHDDNPIHIHEAAAKAAGLVGTVVPGMLLCALTELAFGNVAPNHLISEMKTRFMASVSVGEAVRLVLAPRCASQDTWDKARVFCITQGDVIAAISDIKTRPH
ncbi:MAG: MaoC family dehydratase [Shimia sp.]|uniref:MaoC family dehydratase n=1 Tax=Shimia sp. TaxID=1954381 RepID=UPI004058C910